MNDNTGVRNPAEEFARWAFKLRRISGNPREKVYVVVTPPKGSAVERVFAQLRASYAVEQGGDGFAPMYTRAQSLSLMDALGGPEGIYFLKSEAIRRLGIFQVAAKAWRTSQNDTHLRFEDVRLVLPIRNSRVVGGAELTWWNEHSFDGFHTRWMAYEMDTWKYVAESRASS